MNHFLYRQVEDFDNETTKNTLLLVPEDRHEDFAEWTANKCGEQDYSYQVFFEMLGEFTKDELLELKGLLSEVKEDEN